MSTLKADTIQNTSGGAATLTKQHAPKHWVNYDARGTTTHGSFNQSSLTDNGQGDFTSTYTNSLSATEDKCIMLTSWDTRTNGSSANSGDSRAGSHGCQAGDSVQSASSINFTMFYGANASSDGAREDMDSNYCMSMGDLA